MKIITALASVVFSHQAIATTTADLKVDCIGSFEIIATSNPTYSPGFQPRQPTRVLPIPPSIGFTATVAYSGSSAGCQTLQAKYGYVLTEPQQVLVNKSLPLSTQWFSTLEPTLEPKPVGSLLDAIDFAKAAMGQSGSFSVKHVFGFEIGAELPLFPAIHAETLIINGQLQGNQGGAFSHAINPNLQELYGTPTLAGVSDEEKLAMLPQLLGFIAEKLSSKEYHYFGTHEKNALLIDLKPQSLDALSAYAVLLIQLLEDVGHLQYPPSFFFNFHVGGSGGSPIADVLSELSHIPNLMSDVQKVDLVAKYPAFLLGFGGKLALESADILAALQKISDNVPNLTWSQKYEVHDVLKTILSNHYSAYKKLFTEEIKTVAWGIQEALGSNL